MSEILTWRRALTGMVPRWLLGKPTEGSNDPNSGFWGQRLLHGIGVVVDALGTSLHLGLLSSYPGFGDETALALIGLARGIWRGPTESSAAYATRLRYWRQSRKRQGNPFALMEQLQAYLQPYGMTACIQYDDGTRLQLNPGGFAQAPKGYAGTNYAEVTWSSWNWDSVLDPTRFWLILMPSDALWSNDGEWADAGNWWDLNTSDGSSLGTILDPLAAGDDTPTYGSTASYAVVQGLLSLVEEWTPPHARCDCVILCFDSVSFAALSPNGTWGNPGNRSLDYVYWEPNV